MDPMRALAIEQARVIVAMARAKANSKLPPKTDNDRICREAIDALCDAVGLLATIIEGDSP